MPVVLTVRFSVPPTPILPVGLLVMLLMVGAVQAAVTVTLTLATALHTPVPTLFVTLST